LKLEPAKSREISTPRRRLTIVALALAMLVILFFIQVPPHSLLGKADVVGYGICHRIAQRSFFFAGRQLPLCARCTGTFLGTILGLMAMLLLRRHKAAGLPPVLVLVMLVLFTGFWAFDGLNSYLTFFPDAPNLYQPQNWLRLTSGMLNGLTLIIFVFPVFNFTLWGNPLRKRAIKSIWELLALLPVVALLVLAVQAEIDVLLYPVAILSTLGVMMMLTIINTMIATVALGREGYARTWLEALVPLIVGLAMAILQLTAMVLLRIYLTTKLGLPF
jgi:uncharacterized membrane protein